MWWQGCCTEHRVWRILRMPPHVTPLHPQIVAIALEALDKCVHRDLDHIVAAGALHRSLAVLDPALHGKVGGLGTVKAVIEAGMIAERKCDHDLARLLRDLQEPDLVRPLWTGLLPINAPYWRARHVAWESVVKSTSSCGANMRCNSCNWPESTGWPPSPICDHTPAAPHTTSLAPQSVSNWWNRDPCPPCAMQRSSSTCQSTSRLCSRRLSGCYNPCWHSQELCPAGWCSSSATAKAKATNHQLMPKPKP